MERGSATVEFVLIVPLVLLLLVALVEVAVVARTSLTMAAAAREGARVAATTPDTDMAIEATRTALGDELAALVRVTVRRPPVVGEPAVVSLSGSHVVLAALGGFRVPLTFSATMRVEG